MVLSLLVLLCLLCVHILNICRISYFLALERFAVFLAAQAADPHKPKPCGGFRQRLLCSPKLEAATRGRAYAPQLPEASANSHSAAAGVAVSQSAATTAAASATAARMTYLKIFVKVGTPLAQLLYRRTPPGFQHSSTSQKIF